MNNPKTCDLGAVDDEKTLIGLILASGIVPAGLMVSDFQTPYNQKAFKAILEISKTIRPDIVKASAKLREEGADNSLISHVITSTDLFMPANKEQVEFQKKKVIENSRNLKARELFEQGAIGKFSINEVLLKVNELNIVREKKQTTIIKTFSEIVPVKILWLWLNRIALGKLSIFAGNPGTGKSQSTILIAAIASRGGTFPDGSKCPLGDTIILTSEDDDADTISPRLVAAGADMSRVHIIKGVKTTDGKVKPITLKMVEAFYDAVCQIRNKGHDLVLLIIDPLDGLLDGGDGNSNEEVRAALDGICRLAEEEKFAIIGIKHLNKSKNDIAYRIGGSMAWTAKARSVWVFVEDKETGRRMFLPLKNNLGIDKGGFYYSIQQKDIGGIIAPYFNWEGVADDDLQEVLNSSTDRSTSNTLKQEEVINVLKEAGGSIKLHEIAAALNKSEQSISNILYRLKDRGEVISPSRGLWELSFYTSTRVNSPMNERENDLHASTLGHSTRVNVKTDEVETEKQPALELNTESPDRFNKDIANDILSYLEKNQHKNTTLDDLTVYINGEAKEIIGTVNKLLKEGYISKYGEYFKYNLLNFNDKGTTCD